MGNDESPVGIIVTTLDGKPLEAAAVYLVAREHRALPDLSSITVILPTLYPAADFSAALGRAAGHTILLPHITTLKAWAEHTPIERPILANSQREALLYQALKNIDWLQGADLWQISAELLTLFDELTTRQITLPRVFDDFLQQLEIAYQGGCGASLHFEATLVHQLWFAMVCGAEAEIDPAAAYLMQLTQLTTRVSAPVYTIGLGDLTPSEDAFLAKVAQYQPVIQLHQASNDPAHELLATAWANPEHDNNLRSRALAFQIRYPHSPLQGKITLFAATGLEQEAQAVDVKVRQWLLDGKTRIAIVVQDRLVARRTRALLERAQVLVADETGWTFSTTTASTVVHRWLDNFAGHFYHSDLLDLLKSPYIFADWEVARRKRAVYELEQLLRHHQVVSRLENYLKLAHRAAANEIIALLQRLAAAEQHLTHHPKPITTWLDGLLSSLDALGICQGLALDIAGQQLLELLSRLQREMATDSNDYCFVEWRHWLNYQLEYATFRDATITSPVVFTHLANTRLRQFDGVIIAGADATHLPGATAISVFFNQGVRAQLGLATQRDKLDGLERDLIAVLANSDASVITWQSHHHAEAVPASPYVERLQTFHNIAYHDALQDNVFADILTHGWATLPTGNTTLAPYDATPPCPPPPASLVPMVISASGYQSMMTCPYQYFARHILQLNPLDEIREELEKRDYGDIVHRILQDFHTSYPVISGIARDTLTRTLALVSDKHFATAIAADYLSYSWALRWNALIPAYLDWQLTREAAGWRIAGGELVKTRDISLEEGHTLTVKGRIDRIDINPNGKLAILDYKTQSLDRLKKRLDIPGEDVQLPLYAWLADDPSHVDNATFLSLEKNDGHLKDIGLEDNLATLCTETHTRLTTLFNQIYRGTPLPAQGTAKNCSYCEMRGLCRKDYWSESDVS